MQTVFRDVKMTTSQPVEKPTCPDALSHLDRLKRVSEIGAEMTAIRNTRALFEFTVYQVSSRLRYQTVSLGLIREDKLVYVAGAGDYGKYLHVYEEGQEQLCVPVGEYITGWVAAHGRSRLAPDVTEDPLYLEGELLYKSDPIRSELAIPVKRGQNVLGVLNIESTRVNDFKEEDQTALELLSSQFAACMENVALYEREHNRLEELTRMNAKLETEIEERRKAEQAKRETEEITRSITEHSPDYIMMLDLDGRILYLNRTVSDLTLDQVMGKMVYEFVPDSVREDLVDCLKRVRETGRPDKYQTFYEHGSGAVLTFEAVVGPIMEHGRVAAYTVISRDVTERDRMRQKIEDLNTRLEERVEERTRELEGANRDLEAFVYSVSHDLRAPLRSVTGFSQALLEDYEGHLDETGQDLVKRVHEGATRMKKMIEALLNFARVSRRDLHIEPLNISRLARDIVADISQRDPERDVEFIITPRLRVYGDPQLIRIVLENLLDNAWKFTRRTPKARIEFGSLKSIGYPVYFVRDNGVGFDQKYKERLFKPFQRLHNRQDFEGDGIGLATAARIIHRHSGRVWVESDGENEGATFYFQL